MCLACTKLLVESLSTHTHKKEGKKRLNYFPSYGGINDRAEIKNP